MENEDTDKKPTLTEIRNSLGEAYMWCEDCGARLYSFDGNKDASRRCPYINRNGECDPK